MSLEKRLEEIESHFGASVETSASPPSYGQVVEWLQEVIGLARKERKKRVEERAWFIEYRKFFDFLRIAPWRFGRLTSKDSISAPSLQDLARTRAEIEKEE